MKIRNDLIKPVLPLESGDEIEDVLPSYHLGIKENYFLSLQFVNGSCRAFPYGDIILMKYHPLDGISLFLLNLQVHLLGVELGELYKGLLERRVTEIKEIPANSTCSFFEVSSGPQGQVNRIVWNELKKTLE